MKFKTKEDANKRLEELELIKANQRIEQLEKELKIISKKPLNDTKDKGTEIKEEEKTYSLKELAEMLEKGGNKDA